tara:strand:- start:541 stop:708 length:168 start_codon:yes stop_codon:yes gene_type:complete
MTNEALWKKDQQEKCKLLCGEPALQGWRYANMCKLCYADHQKAMINLCSINEGVL